MEKKVINAISINFEDGHIYKEQYSDLLYRYNKNICDFEVYEEGDPGDGQLGRWIENDLSIEELSMKTFVKVSTYEQICLDNALMLLNHSEKVYIKEKKEYIEVKNEGTEGKLFVYLDGFTTKKELKPLDLLNYAYYKRNVHYEKEKES